MIAMGGGWARWGLAVLLSAAVATPAPAAPPLLSAGEARMLEIASLGEHSIEQAEQGARDWIQQSVRAGDAIGEGYARLALAGLWRRAGRHAEAAVEYLNAQDAAKRAQSPELQAQVDGNQGVNYALAGLHAEAIAALGAAEKGFAELGNWRRAAAMLGNIGNVLAEAGEIEAAREHYQRALAMKLERGIDEGIGTVYNNLADLASDAGDRQGARDHLQRAIEANRSSPRKDDLVLSLVNMARLDAEEFQLDAGFARLGEAEALLDAGAGRLRASVEEVRAQLHLQQSKDRPAAEAMALLDQALNAQSRAAEMAERMDDPERRARVAQLGSDILAARGDWRGALHYREQAEKQQQEAAARLDRGRYAVLRTQYEQQREARELAELRQQQSLQRSELQRQRSLIALAALLVLVLLAVIALMWRRGSERRGHARSLAAHNRALGRALDDAEAMRQRAEHFAALNSRMLGLAGDDLRTHLLQMRSIAERLLVERHADAELGRQMAVLAAGAGDLLRTVEQMVDSGSADAQPRTPAPVDVQELARSLLAEAASRYAGQGRDLRVEAEGESHLAAVDGARLQLILHELLRLVLVRLRATQPLHLHLHPSAGGLELWLDDPGLGADPLAASSAASGSLGLLWIEGALRRLGGELRFDGPPVFALPRIRILLPVAAQPAGDPGSQPQGEREQQAG